MFNTVNVNLGARRPDHFDGRATSSSLARRLDSLVEEPVREMEAKRDELRKAALPYRHDGPPGRRWKNDNAMVRVVPTSQMAAAIQQVYQGHEATPMVGTGGELTAKAVKGEGEMPGILKQFNVPGRPPTAVVARDDSGRPSGRQDT